MTLRELERKLDGEAMLKFVARKSGQSIRREALDTVRKWSSGNWSLAALAAIGHPYRVGGPNPLDPGKINKQRGVFYSEWMAEQPISALQASNFGTALYLQNDSDVADFMKGTTSMITRPIWERVEDELREPFERAIMAHVEEWFRR